MYLRFPALVLLAFCARSNAQCPPVSFLSPQSATLNPAQGVHRVLLKQSDGSYTAFEMSDAPPHGLIRKIPNFQKQLSPCQPTTTGLPSLDALAVAQTPEGGYIIAFQGPPETGGADIAVFDSNLNLTAEAPTELYPLVFADVNGDGKLDLIGRTFEGPDGSTQNIIVALGTGGANFQGHSAWHLIVSGLGFVGGCAVADVNGDHKPDIIATSQYPNNALLFLGNGDGTFKSGTTIAPSNEPGEVAIADLNGDGKPDLIFSDAIPPNNQLSVEIALGHGDGTFGAPSPYAVGDRFTVADVNGDGVPDIVTNGVTILFGDGKGGFGNRRDFLMEAYGDPIVTDFNGDGIPDILIGFNGAGLTNIGSGLGNSSFILGDRVTVLLGLGNGKFASPPISLTDISFLIATGDVNGDGIPDLISGDLEGHVGVLLGVGDGTFRGSTAQFSPFVESLVLADFNHDGKIDLAVGGDLYNSSNVVVNARTGEVQGERPYSAWKIAALVGVILFVIAILLLLRSQG